MNRLLICLLFVCFAVACGSSDKSLQPGETITLSEGDILLTDAAQRALFRIHPTSGDRTVVSNRIPMSRSSVQVLHFWGRSDWCEKHLANS